MLDESLQRRLPWLGAALVLVWRLVAVWYPHPGQTDPAAVRHATAVMGLWFVACGLWALVRAPGRLSILFAWYGVTAGLHWGGPLGIGSEGSREILLIFYFVVSSFLAQALFLHVAITFDRSRRPRAAVKALVYAVPAVGALLLVVRLLIPGWRVLGVLPPLMLLATLCSLVGAGFWIARWLRAAPSSRRELGLGRVVAAIVFGWLPYVLVSAGLDPWPEYSGFANLPMALEPAAVAAAIGARGRHLASRGAPV